MSDSATVQSRSKVNILAQVSEMNSQQAGVHDFPQIQLYVFPINFNSQLWRKGSTRLLVGLNWTLSLDGKPVNPAKVLPQAQYPIGTGTQTLSGNRKIPFDQMVDFGLGYNQGTVPLVEAEGYNNAPFGGGGGMYDLETETWNFFDITNAKTLNGTSVGDAFTPLGPLQGGAQHVMLIFRGDHPVTIRKKPGGLFLAE